MVLNMKLLMRKISVLMGTMLVVLLSLIQPAGATDRTTSAQEQKERIVIVFDPKFGGNQCGAQSLIDGQCANLYNLEIAQDAMEYLLPYKDKIQTKMTRNDNSTDMSDEERGAFVRREGADILIVVSLNSMSTILSANGAETYYNLLTETKSKKLSRCIQEEVIRATRFRNRHEQGQKPHPYLVKVAGEIVGAHVSPGFFTNREDHDKLRNRAFRKTIGQAIGKGILKYCDIPE